MLLQNRTLLSSLLAIGMGFGLVACGDDDEAPPMDGGGTDGGMMMMDAGGRDGGVMPPNVCEEVRAVTGEMGITTVTGDTSMVTSRPRDLGADCGNPDAARFAPQEVIAYTVPGTGPIGLRFSTRHAATAEDFLTLIQVREACETIPTDANTCILTGDEDWRAEGAIMAEGGSTLYVVVTGWSDPEAAWGVVNEGPWELTIETVANTGPMLTHGAGWYSAGSFELAVSGTDDGIVDSYQADLLDASGAPVDVNDDGAPDVIGGPFLNDPMGSPFTGYDQLGGVRELLTDAAVTQLSVVVYDEFGLASDPLMISIGDALGVGDTCGDMAYCAVGLECATMMCAPAADVATACSGATAITLATPTTTTTSTTVSGSVPAGPGVLAASCTAAPDAEVLYTLTVPAGAFDVLARTDLAGTGETDTVLSLRSDCGDPTTEVACNDDIDLMGMNYASELELRDVAAGTYTFVVEQYGEPGMAGAFGLEVSLRPVLATGAACDMAGVMNRCAGGACAAGMCP